jgi:hypothetical protein
LLSKMFPQAMVFYKVTVWTGRPNLTNKETFRRIIDAGF